MPASPHSGATLYVGGQNGTDATGALLDGLEALKGDFGPDVSGSHYEAQAVKVYSLLQSR
jgi:hypothetical protein